MITPEIRQSLKQAIAELKLAENELNRPDEDVVTISVCLSAKNAMSSLMQLYLRSQSSTQSPASLNSLLLACRKADKQFEAISLSSVLCNQLDPKDCDHKYCLGTHTVKECVSTARQLKTVVLKALKLNEAELV